MPGCIVEQPLFNQTAWQSLHFGAHLCIVIPITPQIVWFGLRAAPHSVFMASSLTKSFLHCRLTFSRKCLGLSMGGRNGEGLTILLHLGALESVDRHELKLALVGSQCK